MFKKTRHAVTNAVAPKEVSEREKQGTNLLGVILTEKEILFTRQFKHLYLPYEEIEWAYLQIAESRVTLGCCGGVIAEYRIMYRTANGNGMIILDRENNAKAVLEKIRTANQNCAIGYTAENKKRFGVS